MRISIVCACLLLQASFAFAQVSESFDYQNITEAISWKGTDTAWQIQASRLQSRLRQASSSFHLSTSSLLARNAIWEWWLQLDFNTSSLNYVDVFLVADSANLQAAGCSGYFVRIGGTKDDISLYRKDGNAPPVLLIDGRDGITDHTSTTLKIKVTRKENDWELWTDEQANGTAYSLEGHVMDNKYNVSQYMGIVVRQSTASFFGRHYFDDILVTPLVKDTLPPHLQSLQLVNDHTLTLCFNEPLDTGSLAKPGNFLLSVPGNGPVRIWQDSSLPACVHIQYREAFPNGDSCRLSVSTVKDVAGNSISPFTAAFLYYTSRGYDVLIHEILPRALPSGGLLPARFVELRNNSPYTFQLKAWRLSNSSREVVLPAYELRANGLVVLCDKGSVSAFSTELPVLGVSSFPAPGDSDVITLRNDSGVLVHAVGYDRSWYNNPVKEKGGWSLEMIDPNWPCAGSTNWSPAIVNQGGTPGKSNSVAGNSEQPPPVSLVKAYAPDTMTVSLSFSGITDSAEVTNKEHYHFTPSLSVAGIIAQAPLYNNVSFKLSAPLLPDTIYTVAVSGIRDCTGQEVTTSEVLFARVSSPDSFDIVINEILYDPATGVPEFIEIYNGSHKVVDLQQLYLAKRKEDGQLGDVTALGDQPELLLPGAYAAFTIAPDMLCAYYTCQEPANVHQVTLPALINGDGVVVLLNAAGQVLDELHYTDHMHVGIADHTKGVSLERLQANAPTQDKYNWHSAASSAGYATPGARNSQLLPLPALEGSLTVQPAVFSPDGDGWEDLVTIRYNFSGPGHIINVTVFDTEGRPVRYLGRNTLVPASGYMTWDGQGEGNRRLVTGIYVIFAEVFDTKGELRHWKMPIVLGKRLN